MIQLKILKGPQKVGEEFEIKNGKSMLLGRSTHCDVQLLSFGISKQHCKLTALPGGRVEVEDLGSSNGTFVNGVQVQKHIVRPGDSLSLSEFLFQILWKPDAIPAAAYLAAAPQNITPITPAPSMGGISDTGSTPIESARVKKESALAKTFSSWIDPVAENFPIHKLLFALFFAWTLGTVCLSIFPFSQRANLKIQENSIETAKLYARQLARLNAKAVLDQRISDIVPVLDERPGATRGIIKTYIFDAQRGRIMAPTSEAGNSLPNHFAVVAVQQTEVWSEFDPAENVAYVSAPILVGTPEGDAVVATAFVQFDPSSDVFSFANILENALTSLLILLSFSLVAVFIYQRFVLAPVQVLASAVERAVISGASIEKTNVQWPELQDIHEKLSILVSRLPSSSSNNQTPEEWSANIARELTFAAAAFDSSLKILEWNAGMEEISGVRREYAVGSDIGVASRDGAFEGSVRELAGLAQNATWVPQSKSLDFQGRNCVLSMVYGASHFLLLIRREGEG